MFSPPTQRALAGLFHYETGAPGLVTLDAEVYRELVAAARQWDALMNGPLSVFPRITLTVQPDGSIKAAP